MAHLLIRHRVSDYTTWKAAFDGFINNRREAGEKSNQIFHPGDDASNLFILFEWDSIENAQKFMGAPELKEAMTSFCLQCHPFVQSPDTRGIQANSKNHQLAAVGCRKQ